MTDPRTPLPGGASWSRVCKRNTALTLTDVEGGANVSALLYRAARSARALLHARHAEGPARQPDHVRRGAVLRHGPRARVGHARHVRLARHDHRPRDGGARRRALGRASPTRRRATTWRRSARDALLVELAKHGLGARDLVANVNFFTKVGVDDGRRARGSCAGNSRAGDAVTLRFELDTLVVLCSVPHPLDPAAEWAPRPVALELASVDAARDADAVRRACAENERGFAASEEALR